MKKQFLKSKLTAFGIAMSMALVPAVAYGEVIASDVITNLNEVSSDSNTIKKNTRIDAYKGTINNLVVCISFADSNEFMSPQNQYNDLFNAQGDRVASLYNYYKEVSYGALNVHSTFVPCTREDGQEYYFSYKAPHDRDYYTKGTEEKRTYIDTEGNEREYTHISENQNFHELLTNALEYAKNQVPTNLELDHNGDGRIDAVTFICEVPSSVSDQTLSDNKVLWPHYGCLGYFSAADSDIGRIDNVEINGAVADKYILLPSNWLDRADGSLAPLAHEFFHMSGAPDLYTGSSNTRLVRFWDLMDDTSNPNHNYPQHMLGYMKYLYGGFINQIPEITESGTYVLETNLTPTSNTLNNTNIYKIQSQNPNECYYIEYRNQNSSLFEESAPATGVVIYKVNKEYDTNIGKTKDNCYIRSYSTARGEFCLKEGDGFLANEMPLSDQKAANFDILNVAIQNDKASFTIKMKNNCSITLDQPDQASFSDEIAINPSGAEEIYYTLDGSEPNSSSFLYEKGTPIIINHTTTLKLVGYTDGIQRTVTKTAQYTKTIDDTDFIYSINSVTDGQKIAGDTVNIAGWMLSKEPIEKIEVLLNNKPQGTATTYAYDSLNKFFSGYDTSQAGFSYKLDVSDCYSSDANVTVNALSQSGSVLKTINFKLELLQDTTFNFTMDNFMKFRNEINFYNQLQIVGASPITYYTTDGKIPSTSSNKLDANQVLTLTDTTSMKACSLSNVLMQSKVTDFKFNKVDTIETNHEGQDQVVQTWVIDIPNATSLDLTFDEQTDYNGRFQELFIADETGAKVNKRAMASYELAGKTLHVEGGKVFIQLYTSGYQKNYGFKINEIKVNASVVDEITLNVPNQANFIGTMYITPGLKNNEADQTYYTLDGTTPTNQSNLYTPGEEIALSDSTTIQFVGYKAGQRCTAIKKGTYTKVETIDAGLGLTEPQHTWWIVTDREAESINLKFASNAKPLGNGLEDYVTITSSYPAEGANHYWGNNLNGTTINVPGHTAYINYELRAQSSPLDGIKVEEIIYNKTLPKQAVQGKIETPIDSQAINSLDLPIKGWVASNKAIKSIEVLINGIPAENVIRTSRDDLGELNINGEIKEQIGFEALFDLSTFNIYHNELHVVAKVTTEDDQVYTIKPENEIIIINSANLSYTTKVTSLTVQDKKLTAYGWSIGARATESYKVYVDGTEIADCKVTQIYDVPQVNCDLFQGEDSERGFSFNLDLSAYGSGEHSLKVQAIDNQGNISQAELPFTIVNTEISTQVDVEANVETNAEVNTEVNTDLNTDLNNQPALSQESTISSEALQVTETTN